MDDQTTPQTPEQPQQPTPPPEQPAAPQQPTPPPPPPPPEQPAAEAAPAPEGPQLQVKIGDWLKAGWELFKPDILKNILAVLITAVIASVTCGILAGPMKAGLIRCFIKKARGQDYEYGDLFDGIKLQFLPSFILVLVAVIAVMIPATILNFIPCVGQLAAAVWALCVYTITGYALCQIADADETVELGAVFDMLKGVWKKLQPLSVFAMFVLWFLVMGIVSGIGGIACGIGVLFTAPIGTMAFVVSYLDAFRGEQPVMPPANETPAQ